MTEDTRPLRPPLKPGLTAGGQPNGRPKLLKNFQVKVTTPPPVEAPTVEAPPNRKKKAKPLSEQPLRLYFCRQCDLRIASRLPPTGWINIRRHIFPGSVQVPENMSPSDRWLHRRRVSMGLGLYCSATCLAGAMPRVVELIRQLDERGVGLKRLGEGEAPPVMPPCAQKGGAE
ncbi:MAG TPA: hypothetical protein VKD24_05895 [Candidatus Angelobacter sp.]|nr:hypothetical protein [Candidatus Angelobacter sp.]